jgi:hypothetical protein
MGENKKTFHEWALESILFKGRQDWYFCFLKAERIAHVLALLSEKVVHEDRQWFLELVDEASDLPHVTAHFVAGDVAVELLLADIFSLISSVRLSGTRGFIARDTAQYIVQEYEAVAQKLIAGTQLSPFVSPQDFSVPDFLLRPKAPEALPLPQETGVPVPVRQARPPQKRAQEEGGASAPQTDRRAAILHFVLQNKAVSIKEICAAVTDCSEKTVQRELTALIAEGLIKREGERRWSVYKPA